MNGSASAMAVAQDHLEGLYADTDDPWGFRTSRYEAARFDATLAALPRTAYQHILEVGCGNGELARRLAQRSAAYTGLDAVEAALDSAKAVLPDGQFVRAFLPCALPKGRFDLIVLSEILYFLDGSGLTDLARQIDTRWPDADVVAVTWLGPSGNPLEGDAAFAQFASATSRQRRDAPSADPRHRIDVFAPLSERRRI